MTLTLRPYQTQLIDDIRAKWAGGARNVLAVMPTGAGKTVTFSKLNADGERSCTIVHRQELVGQISRTYALTGIYHNIIAPQPMISRITHPTCGAQRAPACLCGFGTTPAQHCTTTAARHC